jgi:lysophospholipase L1-like esterase
MYGATPVLVVSLKPSPARWANRPLQLLYNAEVRQLATDRTNVRYVAVDSSLMYGDKPGDFYVADGVHLTAQGYRRWAPLLSVALKRELGEPSCPDSD